jgi:hypothetical protein
VFHSNTQRLIDTWRALRPKDAAPRRSDFDPCALPGLLPQLFLLGDGADLPVRLSGGLVEDLFGRTLRGETFLALWRPESRAAVRCAARVCQRGCEPAVIHAEGLTETGVSAGFELMLAPLANRAGDLDRILGLVQSITPLVRLHGEQLSEFGHKLTVFAGGEADASEPLLRHAAVDGRESPETARPHHAGERSVT